MTLHWGVDSSWYPVNHEVRVPGAFLNTGEQGPVREHLFDYVTRRAGQAPEFWGRYLNDNHPQTRLRPEEPLTFSTGAVDSPLFTTGSAVSRTVQLPGEVAAKQRHARLSTWPFFNTG